MTTAQQTVLELVAAECSSQPSIRSLPEALGLIQVQLQVLTLDVGVSAEMQDAEAIMQRLVSAAAVAVSAAAGLVMPVLDKEDA